jgi:hypothetical protein
MKPSNPERESDSAPLRPLRDEPRVRGPGLLLVAQKLHKIRRLPASEHHRRRIWMALTAHRTAPARPSARLSTMIPAVILLASAASATARHYFDASRLDAGQSTAAPHDEAHAAPRSPTPSSHAFAVASETPSQFVEGQTARNEEREALPEQTVIQESPRPSASPVKRKPAKRDKASAEADPETALLLQALQARREGDAEAMSRLSEEYRRKHPKGALGEEAWALSVEAAAARRDPSTQRLAADYLRRFPNGSFRARVQQALQQSP